MKNKNTKKLKKNTRKSTKKYKQYDLYNGDKWNNYRLGDIIYGQLACYHDFCLEKNKDDLDTCEYIDWKLTKKWCKDWTSIWADPHDKTKSYIQQIHKNFPKSFAAKYVSMIGFPHDYKIEDFSTIRKIFSTFHYKKPTKNTLVIHLRLGDVLAPYYKNEYAYGFEYYQDLLQRIKKNKHIPHIDIVTGLHTNTYVKPSNKMLQRIMDLYKTVYPVSLILTKNPDKDFYYMCHSKYFASSGGGFSRLISNYVKKHKGKVYDNPSIILETVLL